MVDQVRYTYKKIKQDSIVNIEMIKQEIEDDRLAEDNDNKGEENPYKSIFMDDFDRNNIIAPQMEQWSILSNIVTPTNYRSTK